MEKKTTLADGIGIAVMAILALLILSLLFSFPAYWFWNAVAVSKFGAPELTWLETWMLLWLTRMFLGPWAKKSEG